MLTPGLGPEEHIRSALNMQHPYHTDFRSDDDLEFAARVLAWAGPFWAVWRQRQIRAIQSLKYHLRPLERALETAAPQCVQWTTGRRSPAFIAALTALLRWPDRSQAGCSQEGFRIIGEFEPTHLFRPIQPQGTDDLSTLYGPEAARTAQEQVRQREPKHAEEVYRLTLEEEDKGYCGPEMTKQDLDRELGEGQWRAMPRFMVISAGDRPRLIDDARRGAHNSHCLFHETIRTISVDFTAETVRLLLRWILVSERGPDILSKPIQEQLAALPDWVRVEASCDDLPDAYRGTPVAA